MGSPFEPSEASFDPSTFRAAATELLTTSSDAAVSRFLHIFSLSSVLSAVQLSTDPEIQHLAVMCLRAIIKSESATCLLPAFIPNIEQGLFSPSEELQSISCLAAQRIGEMSQRTGEMSSPGKPKPHAGGIPEVVATSAAPGADAAAGAASRQLLANKVLVRGLLECVGSTSVSLSVAASDAILSLSISYPDAVEELSSEPTLTQLRAMLTQSPTSVQQRIVALSIRLASASDTAATLVKKLGVVEVLLGMIGGEGYARASAEFQRGAGEPQQSTTILEPSSVSSTSPPDELAALTACELLTDFVRHPRSSKMISLSPNVTGAVLHLLQANISPSHSVVSGSTRLLVGAAWKAAACLISPPTAGVPSSLTELEAVKFSECLSEVCGRLGGRRAGTGVFDVDTPMGGSGNETDSGELEGSQDSSAWEDAVYEASSIISARSKGASLLLRPNTKNIVLFIAEGAFGTLTRRVTSELQVAALHALASVLGAERGENRRVCDAPPTVLVSPEEVELGSTEETALREAVYYAAVGAPDGPALGAVLHNLLKGDEVVRVAVYRLIAILVERPWGLAEVCGHTSVIEMITDPLSERNKEAMDWRHTSVVAAATAAATHTAALSSGVHYDTRISSETVSKLEAAARMGPYAVRRIIEAIPTVAVAERPPMGM